LISLSFLLGVFVVAPSRKLHEIVLPVLISLLVARGDHVLLGKHLVVGMVLLPFLFLAFLGDAGFFFFLFVC